MSRTPLFLVLLLATTTVDAQGAADPTATPPLTPMATRHGGKVGGKIRNGEKRAKNRNDVRGKCTMMETPLNPISGPCVSVPLELKDSNGSSLGVARTNAQGEFNFAVEDDGPYTLAPTTDYYVVVSPGGKVERGHPVNLRIKGKN